jgi:hypothetical protein
MTSDHSAVLYRDLTQRENTANLPLRFNLRCFGFKMLCKAGATSLSSLPCLVLAEPWLVGQADWRWVRQALGTCDAQTRRPRLSATVDGEPRH